jgi:hypothetical protein
VQCFKEAQAKNHGVTCHSNEYVTTNGGFYRVPVKERNMPYPAWLFFGRSGREYMVLVTTIFRESESKVMGV